MGTWGPGIFSDDTALDIRGEFKELIGNGQSTEDATDKLLQSYASDIKDPFYAPRFWIALAATQFRYGRLQEKVRQSAVKVIDTEADLKNWKDNDPKLISARKKALLKLRDQLLGPQKPPTKIRPVFHDRTDWEPGYAVGYRLLSGNWTIMRVVWISEGKSRIPAVELLDWVGGTEFPNRFEISGLPLRNCLLSREIPRRYFAVYSLGPRDYPKDRVRVIETGVDVWHDIRYWGCSYFGGWKKLDDYLLRSYSLQ